MMGDAAVGIFMAVEAGLLLAVPPDRFFVGRHEWLTGFAIQQTLVAGHGLLDPAEFDGVVIKAAAVFVDGMLHLGQPGDGGAVLGLPPLDVVALLGQPGEPPLMVGLHDGGGGGAGGLGGRIAHGGNLLQGEWADVPAENPAVTGRGNGIIRNDRPPIKRPSRTGFSLSGFRQAEACPTFPQPRR